MNLITLANGNATCAVSLYGGQILSWQVNGKELLWSLPMAEMEKTAAEGKAMRGGIPICWPWFGPYANQLNLPEGTPTPQHGWGRLSIWHVKEQSDTRLKLTLQAPYDVPLSAELIITLAPTYIDLAIVTTNQQANPITIGSAFHTYFPSADATQARIEGLEGRPRLSLQNRTPLPGIASDLVRPVGWDDYFGPEEKPVRLIQPGHPTMVLESALGGMVVWSPTPEQAGKLGVGTGPGGVAPFVCLEAALPPEGLPLPGRWGYKLEARYALDSRKGSPL